MIRVQPEGNLTWQAVRVIATARVMTTSRSTTLSAAPKATTAAPASTIDSKDETGWVQLGD